MEFKILKYDLADGVGLITISRPGAMNALNSEFFIEFNHLLDQISADKQIRVLVITGEGKAFVAGADIAEMSTMNTEQALKFAETGQRTYNRLEGLDIPVIAAVNGFALGGGCELAMACDFRYASTFAKFGQPELNLGLIPGYAGTQRLSRLTGLGNALHLIITTDMIGAEDALRIGLVQKVTDPENLIPETMKSAQKIAGNGSVAAKVVKQVIRKGIHLDFKSATDMEASEFSKLFKHDVTKEGMAAFLEKRKPNW